MIRQQRKAGFYIKPGLFVLWLVVNGIFFAFHEPWRDEAQVWLLARDLPLWKIPAQMVYEGHPCMWHLIIAPFVKLGFPYITMRVIAFIFMASAVALLLWKAEFSLWMKAVLIFSPFCTYFYPVVARSYCQIPLLLFLLAYFHKDRNKRPVRYAVVLALLLQTHAILSVTTFLIGAGWFVESCLDFYKEKNWQSFWHRVLPLGIPFFSGLFLIWQFLGMKQGSRLLQVRTPGFKRMILQVLEKFIDGLHTLTGFGSRVNFVIFLIGLAFLLYVVIKKRNQTAVQVGCVIALTGFFQFWFYAMMYNFSLQRLMTFPLVIIWGIWVLETEKEAGEEKAKKIIWRQPGKLVFCIFTLLTLFYTFPDMKRDLTELYSNGRDTAQFIKENIPEDAIILTDCQAECSSIFPYLNKRTYLYAPTGEEYSYVVWDDDWLAETDYDSFKHWVENLETGDKQVILISAIGHSRITENEKLEEYPLLYQSWYSSIKEEDFKIYRIR